MLHNTDALQESRGVASWVMKVCSSSLYSGSVSNFLSAAVVFRSVIWSLLDAASTTNQQIFCSTCTAVQHIFKVIVAVLSLVRATSQTNLLVNSRSATLHERTCARSATADHVAQKQARRNICKQDSDVRSNNASTHWLPLLRVFCNAVSLIDGFVAAADVNVAVVVRMIPDEQLVVFKLEFL